MVGSALQAPFTDPTYLQHLKTAQYAAALSDPFAYGSCMGNSYMNFALEGLFCTLLSQQKSQYGVPLFGKTGGFTPYGYYSNPAFGIGLSNLESPTVIPSSPVGPGSPMGHEDFNMRFPSGVRNVAAV